MMKAAGMHSAIDTAVWLDQMRRLGGERGTFSNLGPRHYAMGLEGDSTLLVSFESAADVRARPGGQPMGWSAADEAGWSYLGLMCERNTWFRGQDIYDFFDAKIDEGFFDEFDRVVFFGTSDCGYAAAAYSVCAPGAKVVLITPQATLDPEITGWDLRHKTHRRLNFNDRFGYAPDMVQAANEAFILYDPNIYLDAMHAALFTAPNVTKLPCRHLGPDVVNALIDMGILPELIDAACEGQLTPSIFHQLMRARRSNQRYLLRLLDQVEAEGHQELALKVAKYAHTLLGTPKFKRRLQGIEQRLAQSAAQD